MAPVIISEKKCWRCEDTKPTAEFNKCSKHSDGLQKACRACQHEQYREGGGAAKAKERYHANPEPKRTAARVYMAGRRERTKAYQKVWNANNREYVLARGRANYTRRRQEELARLASERQQELAQTRVVKGIRAWVPVAK